MRRATMDEFFDFGANMSTLVETYNRERQDSDEWGNYVSATSGKRRGPIDKTFFEVRRSVCVAGYNRDAIQTIKRKIASLMEEACALESFCVKSANDLEDGAFLVPKVVLVATHCPGKKVLDESENEGQLDRLYDAVCDAGADIMVVLVGLPRTIYKPMSHIICHPKVEEMVFPGQPLLRLLARENCFMTVCEESDLTGMQRNLLKEWLVRPVDESHPVYAAADQMSSSVEITRGGFEKATPESYYSPPGDRSNDAYNGDGYEAATEEHPLADKPRKKKKQRFGFKSLSRKAQQREDLMVVVEAKEEEPSIDLEMDMYKSTERNLEAGASAVF